MQEYQWSELMMSVRLTAKPDLIVASPRFMRTYRKSMAQFKAESEFDLRTNLFDNPLRKGALNRKRKRFVRKAVAKAMKEITQ